MKFSRILVAIVLACFAAAAPLASRAAGGQQTEPPSLPAFGYDIFRPLPEPIVEGPVDDEYLISPGDELVISIWGQLNLKHALTVSEDGYIELPEGGGRVYTNGVSIKELKGVVTEAFSRIYSSYINAGNPAQSTAFVDVRLGKVRKLLIYVMGEAKQQGAYTISSAVATLLNLLTNAGGVTEAGSLRQIMIRRADGKVETVDLYDFLVTGKLDPRKSRLRYGDYVIVPLKAKSVTVKGEIRRPGVYEMIHNEGLGDLVRFAGGLAPNASLKRAQVRRFEINAGEKFIDIDLEPILAGTGGKDFVLKDGDEVTILPNVLVRRRMVEVSGEGIKRPGIYEFKPGMTVRDLIEAAEGLKEYVHLERANLIRTDEDFTKRLSTFSLTDLYRETTPGKFVFVGTPEKNFPLREMDRLVVYSIFAMRGGDKRVTLEGHVKEPGTFVLAGNMKLYDIMFSRGGFTDENFRKRAYLELGHIFRRTPGQLEERILTFNLGKLLDGAEEENLVLEDGDRVKVYAYETLEAKPYVEIEGLVKRPSRYDMAEGLTLEDLILVAGGLRIDAYRVEAVIARQSRSDSEVSPAAPGDDRDKTGIVPERRIATWTVPIDKDFAVLPGERKTKLEAFDKVVVRNRAGWEPLPVVNIDGEVVHPGNYSLESIEERLSSLVQRAGGLREGGYIDGAFLLRRADILAMSRERSRGYQRISISLRQALENPGSSVDLILKDGDQIFVPLNPGTVEVRGAVRNPGLFQYKKGHTLSSYIELGGGFLSDADRKSVTVFQPDGSAVRKRGLFGDQIKILAGSVIDVPYEREAKTEAFVSVQGAVAKPALIQWLSGKRLFYYIELCGGLAENADRNKISVVTPNGALSEAGGDPLFNPFIPEGAVIRVPVKETDKDAASSSSGRG